MAGIVLTSVIVFAVHLKVVSGENRTSRIYNPIVQLVNFPNDACIGSATSLTGICYSPDECSGISGGYSDGKCAQGFGVCCVIRVSGCGGTVSQNSTHIQNTGYPNAFQSATTCSYSLKKSNTDICFLRLDFVKFVIQGPQLTASPAQSCGNDYLTFTTPSSKDPPKVCGYMNGQHMYLDASVRIADTNPSMEFTFTGTTFERFWQIRVDQIPCGTLYTPPTGCLQWLMPESGNVKSFNYGLDDDYHHLALQDYAVCFRRAAGFCKIAYTPADDGESFYLSFTPSTPTIRARTGESGCPADFLIIPRGTNSLTGQASCQSPAPVTTTHLGRFCGRRLNCYNNAQSNSVIYSDVLPFIIHVEMNGSEGSPSDNKNRGFSLNYRQIKC